MMEAAHIARVYNAAQEWALARSEGLTALQTQTVNVSVSLARMAKAEAALYALFHDAG